jgi:hypothetical protein
MGPSGWNRQCRAFTFELPPGWQDMDLQKLGGPCLAAAESTNAPLCNVFVNELTDGSPGEGLDARAARFVEKFQEGSKLKGQTYTEPNIVVVGSAEGRLFQLTSPQKPDTCAVIVVAVGNAFYLIEFYQKAQPLDGTTFQRILDSWRWTAINDQPLAGVGAMAEQPEDSGWNQQNVEFTFKLPPGWRNMTVQELTGSYLGMMIAGALSTKEEVGEFEFQGKLLATFGKRIIVQDRVPIAFPTAPPPGADEGLDGRMSRSLLKFGDGPISYQAASRVSRVGVTAST